MGGRVLRAKGLTQGYTEMWIWGADSQQPGEDPINFLIPG